MKLDRARYLVCDCEGTMELDGNALARACGADGRCAIHSALCGAERETVAEALADEESDVVIACRHQEPLFRRMAEEVGRTGALGFADIRESSGWTDQADRSLPKIAALLAATVADRRPPDTLTLKSEGRCLVAGRDEAAIEVAERLAARLDVTLLLDPAAAAGTGIMAPGRLAIPVFAGRIVGLRGHLGAFDVTVDGYADPTPSSRACLQFGAARDGVTTRCDIVLDLSGGTPLLAGGDRRHGYLRPDPGNPAAVERALFEAAGLVGEFEKPVYVDYRADRCAHARNGQTGCTRCLDACPLSAISPDGDVVAIDAAVCDGCGFCHAVCPTGAATFTAPGAMTQGQRLRKLLLTYRRAGGETPVLLVHAETGRGAEAIRLMAHFGRGLPAHVLPFSVAELGLAGPELVLPALAYGAARVVLLADTGGATETSPLHDGLNWVQAVVEGLGYGADRLEIWDEIDPEILERRLHDEIPPPSPSAAGFSALGAPRDNVRLALEALHLAAPAPPATGAVALPAGAPFGAVEVDRDACTLCLACVAVCPTGALGDNAETPQLRFVEDACVQCGLCRATCPENAIGLVPRLRFGEDARRPAVLNEEEPFACVRCGTPFGVRASIDRVVAQLAGRHPMFRDAEAADRLMMCGECRVRDQFGQQRNPMQGAAPPRPRTCEFDA